MTMGDAFCFSKNNEIEMLGKGKEGSQVFFNDDG